jgi:hypothetical protein
MVHFEEVHDRFMRAQRENPAARWPEALLRQIERRALILEVSRTREAQGS